MQPKPILPTRMEPILPKLDGSGSSVVIGLSDHYFGQSIRIWDANFALWLWRQRGQTWLGRACKDSLLLAQFWDHATEEVH